MTQVSSFLEEKGEKYGTFKKLKVSLATGSPFVFDRVCLHTSEAPG